jgi:hypothetical protein
MEHAVYTQDLHVARRLYAALSARAAAAHAVLEQLRTRDLRIECDALVHEVANAVYHSAGYDAYERYDTLEEFEQELRAELDEALESAQDGSVRYYVLRPYFNTVTAIDRLPGSRVHSLMNIFYGRPQFDALAVAPYTAPSPLQVAGLTGEEIEVVAADYRRRTLALVNALRTLETALTSARATMTRRTPAELGVSAEVEALLAQLTALVVLPGLPPVARWFGTEADKVNPLTRLPAEFVDATIYAP